MYERILAYHPVPHLPASLCWLRLLHRVGEVVAVVSDVAGNAGPPPNQLVSPLLRALEEQVGLEPAPLALSCLIVTNSQQGDEALLVWEGERTNVAALNGNGGSGWHESRASALATILRHQLPLAPLWHVLPDCVPNQYAPSLRCEIGGRRGEVWRLAPSLAWSAAVVGPEGDAIQRDFVGMLQAQRWALSRLAHLARTHDILPGWLALP